MDLFECEDFQYVSKDLVSDYDSCDTENTSSTWPHWTLRKCFSAPRILPPLLVPQTLKIGSLILVCRVDVALQCPSRPKDHAELTIWTTVWICFHMKALYVPGKSTLVVQNFLTDSTDPKLHPGGFDLRGRLAFNIFQYFLLLYKHWNKAGYKGDNYGMWIIQWSDIINACLY